MKFILVILFCMGQDCQVLIGERFETYEKSTEPVIEYYKKMNLLKVIDGERTIDQ